MRLCSENHDEICYESGNCPLCTALDELEQSQDLTVERETEIEELNEKIDSLNDELAEKFIN